MKDAHEERVWDNAFEMYVEYVKHKGGSKLPEDLANEAAAFATQLCAKRKEWEQSK